MSQVNYTQKISKIQTFLEESSKALAHETGLVERKSKFTGDLIAKVKAMQPVFLGAVFAISSVQLIAIGVVADQISSLRSIAIKTLRESREIHYGVHETRRQIQQAGLPPEAVQGGQAH